MAGSSPPVALTIAGSDSSAGAGIQADLKTFSAFGVYGLTAVTCVVAETPGQVSRIESVTAETIRQQLRLLLTNFPVAAIKTGLLYSSETVSAVTQVMKDFARKSQPRIPLVVDPVMIATSGARLLLPDAVALYENELFPLATLITPNLDEAGSLLGTTIQNRSAMEEAGRDLAKRYGVPVLLKGGHLAGDSAVDLLFQNGTSTEFAAPFVRDVATHGTGCAYSAAITAGLATGLSLQDAIQRAKTFVTTAIRNHFEWTGQSGKVMQALNHSPEIPTP